MSQIQLPDCSFIINPSRFPQYARILKRILKKAEVPYVIESESRSHFAREVRRFCLSGPNRLLVWGGDGTANEAINMFMKVGAETPGILEKKAIGFLRGGSGNGVQDSYEVPVRMMNQLKCYSTSLKDGYILNVDLLKVIHGRRTHYCQLTGLGMDARILDLRNRNTYDSGPYAGLPKSGLASYIHSAAAALLTEYDRKQQQFQIEMKNGKFAFRGTRVNAEFSFNDLQMPQSPHLIEIGTRPYYAKMFRICPDVVCNDGLMGVYLFKFPGRLALARNLIWLWMGRHDQINKKAARKGPPYIERYEVEKTYISSASPFQYHVDGELMQADQCRNGTYSLNVKIKKQVLPLIVPPTFYRKFHMIDNQIALLNGKVPEVDKV